MIVEGMRPLHHGPHTPTALDKKLSYERGIGSGWTRLKEGAAEGGPWSELLRREAPFGQHALLAALQSVRQDSALLASFAAHDSSF